MNCIGPSAPEDADLLAYADNVASPAVRVHVSTCPACHARSHVLERQQRRLQSLLYRAGCPASLKLGEYHLELLAEPAALEVASHLADCPFCRSELADLAKFMASLRRPFADAAGGLFGSWRTIRGRLALEPLGGPPGQMAPAVRGPADEGSPRVYLAEDVLVTVDSWVERLGQPGRIVAGLVVGPVDLTDAEAIIDTNGISNTSAINELGNFLFSDVAPGVHHLVIRFPATGLLIEVDDLTVR